MKCTKKDSNLEYFHDFPLEESSINKDNLLVKIKERIITIPSVVNKIGNVQSLRNVYEAVGSVLSCTITVTPT